ncbi:hypothetical protein IHE55_23215 [Streptomyces pactum]|uniref:ArsR family transcriptional regulator n=1 Tax=Streptomyces pactum TaxID=68249 RepID=A0ABS0NQU0_9ACTN|nr:hypothetical protein [Streptomyces pactum]MBH5337516.1 hypothetical protein [Streptomyces pactum]
MATLTERKRYREAVLHALYTAVADNRTELPGEGLRAQLGMPDADLAAACGYLADEGLVTVEWTSHGTPATVALTHEGLRRMEAEEEQGQAERG